MKLFNLNNIEKDFFNRASGTSEIIPRCLNIHVIQVSEEGKKIQGRKKILETIMTENFPYLAKDKNLQIRKAETNPHFITPKQSTSRQIIVELPNHPPQKKVWGTREK